MSTYAAALFLHLLGVLLLAGGTAVAAVGHGAARRRERPSDVALLLATTRAGVGLVAVGSVLVLAFGLWLVDLAGRRLDEGWLAASLALFVLAIVLGAAGGRRPKRARLLARRLAAEGDVPTEELRALLDDRVALLANYAAALALVAVLLLMVWKPG